jgi:CubicO group peptidase (beta-lactamase class C family)
MTNTSKYLIFVVGFVIHSCVQNYASEDKYTNDKALQDKLNGLINECITFNETVGVSAGILKNNEVAWLGAAGYLNREDTIVANPNMLNRTASIAKPMTAVAIMQLYEKGKIKLNDSIGKYLSYFSNEKGSKITIEHLLTHTSGIGAYQSETEAFPKTNYPSFQDAIKTFKDRPLEFKPGSAYRYTTYGYVILGAIIEAVSKQSFKTYMEEHIWKKVGMPNTNVEIFGIEYENKASLYYKNREGVFEPDIQTNLSVKVPGGGFYSTAEDLLKFGRAILNNELISAETFALMINDPKIKKRGNNGYGMGWFLYGDKKSPYGKVIGHSGSQSGASTQLMIYLDKKVVVTALGNTSECWNEIYNLTDKLAKNTLDAEILKTPLYNVTPVTEKHIQNYSGYYQADNGRVRQVFSFENELYIILNNNARYKIYATTNNEFFIRLGDITLKFPKSKKSNEYDLIIIDNGEKYLYERKKSMANSLKKRIKEQGLESTLTWYASIENINDFIIDNNEINGLGYEFLQSDQTKIAIEIFKINTKAFPESWNVYDSLGEAYMTDKQNKLAIENYEKSLALNPNNSYAIEALKKLR